MVYVCNKCGYEFESDKKPDICPICYAPSYQLLPKKDQQDGTEKKD